MVSASPSPHSLVVLACHGSRDPRYHQAFAELVETCRQVLAPQPLVGGQLELADVSLAQHLIRSAQAYPGIDTLILVPLFFGGGVHVEHDLPAAVREVTETCPGLQVIQTAPLGQFPGLITILQARLNAGHCRTHPPDATIVMSHGSRSAGFAQLLEKRVACLASPGAIVTAFWAQSPSLEERIDHLYLQGYRSLQVLPCFLFPGGILDQIETLVRERQSRYDDLQIELGKPLAPDPELTHLLTEQIRQIGRRLG